MLNFSVVSGAALIHALLFLIFYRSPLRQLLQRPANEEAGNLWLQLLLSWLLAIPVAIVLNFAVIHQSHLYSVLVEEPGFGQAGTAVQQYYEAFLNQYGSNFRTFKHGAFHGLLQALFMALPLLVLQGLLEKRALKQSFYHAAYWTISLVLMGGIICQFS